MNDLQFLVSMLQNFHTKEYLRMCKMQ